MSTLLQDLDEPVTRNHTNTASAQRLRTSMIAMRLSFTWFGTRKTLSVEQKTQAAETFGATGDFLSAGKKLIDTRHAQFKAVTAVKTAATSYWKALSLPFPEPGIRLIHQYDLDEIHARMARFDNELDEAVEELDRHYDDLKIAARRRLGDLYNANDYPATLVGLFAITTDYPSVEPPVYLRQLSPQLYEEECRRVQARFDEAVQLAEQAFLDELASLVEHLSERLSGQSDGKPKVFRDSAVENMTEFFERFRRLNIGSNSELDELVEQAQQVVGGVRPQQLRDNQSLRHHVAAQLSGVQNVLDDLLVDRPRRNIMRRPK